MYECIHICTDIDIVYCMYIYQCIKNMSRSMHKK